MIKFVIILIVFFFFSGLFYAKYAKAQEVNIVQIQSNIITCTNDLKEFGFEPTQCKATCNIINDVTKKDCSNSFYPDYTKNRECLMNHRNLCRSACGCILFGQMALGLIPFTTQVFKDELKELTEEMNERKQK